MMMEPRILIVFVESSSPWCFGASGSVVCVHRLLFGCRWSLAPNVFDTFSTGKRARVVAFESSGPFERISIEVSVRSRRPTLL